MAIAEKLDAAQVLVDAAYELHDTLCACGPQERLRRMAEAQDDALKAVRECTEAADAIDGGCDPSVQVSARKK